MKKRKKERTEKAKRQVGKFERKDATQSPTFLGDDDNANIIRFGFIRRLSNNFYFPQQILLPQMCLNPCQPDILSKVYNEYRIIIDS